MSAQPQYRMVLVGPGDEVLDEVPLDGWDLSSPTHRQGLADKIQDGMGRTHVQACAALPSVEEDDL